MVTYPCADTWLGFTFSHALMQTSTWQTHITLKCSTIALGYFADSVSRLVFPNMEAAFQLFLSLLNMSLQCQPTHTRPHSNLRWLNCQHRFKGQWKHLSDGHPEYDMADLRDWQTISDTWERGAVTVQPKLFTEKCELINALQPAYARKLK